jgi:branched-chain amino acid transport system substrate-binding protein
MRRRIASKRTLPALLAAAAIVAGAAACSTPANAGGTGGAGTQAGAKTPLVIGISLSLTGDFGDTGQAAEKGYELWASQVNKSGGILGRQVQLKIVDDTTSATQVVTNYESLINEDHVDLVFGPVSSLLTVPAARVAARYGYAFIEPAGGAPTVFALHLHNLFLAQPAPVEREHGRRAAGRLRCSTSASPSPTTSYPSRQASGRRPPPTRAWTTRSRPR